MTDHPAEPAAAPLFGRRTLLAGGALLTAGLVAYPLVRDLLRGKSPVFVAKGQKYDGPLTATIRDALLAVGLDPAGLRGRRVLLKPNLVEPTRAAPHLTTHPAMIVAAAEAFRGWGAEVTVGEGPGHVRDTQMVLDESGVGEALADAGLRFVDLNYDDVVWAPNRGGASALRGFHFPRTAAEADLVVSLPKLKTHHWVGMTAAMKNLYGVIPGGVYGWPKNVLHWNGIPETVLDINASLPRTIALVDAIECMEGDGPLMGPPKAMGLLLAGLSPTAVDATAARIMGLAPERITYLGLAADRLGPLAESRIPQHGEPWRPLATPFEMVDLPHLTTLRA